MALAAVPPGNVMKAIADIRKAFWTIAGEPSARAYFDYPVLSWLGRPIDSPTLRSLAARCSVRFSLCSLERSGDDVFLLFSGELLELAKGLAAPHALDGSPLADGPFSAGIGCYCATLSGGAPIPEAIIETVRTASISAKTFELAQVALEWTKGSSYDSSWTTISRARCIGSGV